MWVSQRLQHTTLLDDDNYSAFGVLLTDLSKAFDFLPHEFVIAWLAAYGFDKSSLKFIYSYLPNRKQRVKILEDFDIANY